MAILLSEHLSPTVASLREQRTAGNVFLSGIMMQSECINGNGRNYSKDDISNAVKKINELLKAGNSICGELEHPPTLTINLANVSHTIVDAWMEGNNAMGKMKILNTPSGNTVRALIEGGVRLGVSSRGTGNVNESGRVSDFDFITMDIVSTPSAPDAFPNVVTEAKNNKKIMTLAEAVVHDPKAQKYLAEEMAKFIQSVFKR